MVHRASATALTKTNQATAPPRVGRSGRTLPGNARLAALDNNDDRIAPGSLTPKVARVVASRENLSDACIGVYGYCRQKSIKRHKCHARQ